ncbi:MAG: hypothetical protein J0M16_02310 [Gammaproteobacteria bacterium]|nr:hypothetical protein [Gammaproteobacteria bacterium]
MLQRAGRAWCTASRKGGCFARGVFAMNSIIYLVGLVVVVLAILSFVGLR